MYKCSRAYNNNKWVLQLLYCIICYILQIFCIYRNSVLKSLEQELENMNEINHSLVIVAATIYNHEHSYESALRVLKNDDSIEGYVHLVKNYIPTN